MHGKEEVCSARVQAGSAARTTMVSTQSSNALLQNITTVFGSKASDNLSPLHIQAGDSANITGYETALHHLPRGGEGGRGGSGGRNFFLLAMSFFQAGRATILRMVHLRMVGRGGQLILALAMIVTSNAGWACWA